MTWQPIETAPMDWEDVLLYVPDLKSDHRKVCEGYYHYTQETWKASAFQNVNPTHWMPFPEGPKE